MHEGYIKLWRKSESSIVFQNEGLWKVWTWCLMQANFQAKDVFFQTGRDVIKVRVEPGQFIFGRQSAAKRLRMKESTVRNRMEKLKKLGNLDIKKDSKFSIVSIVNWDTYQVPEKEGGQQKGQHEDSKRTVKGQQEDTTKNVKERNNKEKEKTYAEFVSEFNRISGGSFRGDQKSERQFNARLKTYTKEEILTAAENAAKDKYLMGDNDRGVKYLTPEYITREDKIERWLNNKPQAFKSRSGYDPKSTEPWL